MNSFKTLICFTLIIVASSSSLRDLTTFTDYNSFASICSTTLWTNNESCFNLKYIGSQCCAGSLTLLTGIKLTACYPQGGIIPTTNTSGVSGLATISYICTSSILQISITFTFVMLLLF